MDTLLAIILILIVGIAVTQIILRVSTSSKDAISTFQTVLTIFGLLLGGYWYFVERKGEPHVDLTQTAVAERVSPGYAAVEASIAVKNLGTTLVHIRSADIRLQQVEPRPKESAPVAAIAALKMTDFPDAITDKGGRSWKLFHEAELQWPTLRWFTSDIAHEVEPGETDTITATFIVPCSIATVRVATNLRRTDENPVSAHGSRLMQRFIDVFKGPPQAGETAAAPAADWWKVRSFVDVASACKPKR